MNVVALRPRDRTPVTEGFECYRNGGNEDHCPYVDVCEAALAWKYGYHAAAMADMAAALSYEQDFRLQTKAVQEGRQAREAGIARASCPYTDADGDIESAWFHGWDAEDQEGVSSGNKG